MQLPIALAAVIALQDVTIIDTINGKTLQAKTVVVKDNRIAAITDAPPAGAQVVNGKGKFLIPGLWDMHIHLRGGSASEADNAAMLKLYVANGVTTVREMGGDLGTRVFDWKKEIEDGKRVGPRLYSSGPKLDGAKPSWPGSIPVTTPEEARKAVEQVQQMGADLVKIYFSTVDPAILRAITTEAKKRKLLVAGHGVRNLTVRELVQGGIKDIQHAGYYIVPGGSVEERSIVKDYTARMGTANAMTSTEFQRRIFQEFSSAQEEALFQTLVKNRVWVTPTLAVSKAMLERGVVDFNSDPRRKFVPPSIWASWDNEKGRRRPVTSEQREAMGRQQQKTVELIPRMHRAGVQLLAGSDSGHSNNYTFPGWSLHEELSLMRDAGLSNADALRTATINAARFFRAQKKHGSIEKGKSGDVVLLDANPLTDIRNTTKIAGVVSHGKYYDRKALDQLLAEAGAGK